MSALRFFILVYVCVGSIQSHGQEANKWFLPSDKTVAVALVAHGLNLKPTRMDQLASALAENGIASLRVALPGHYGSVETMKNVKLTTWSKATYASYTVVRSKANELGVPLYLLGSSLGALLSIHLMGNTDLDPQVRYDRLVLLAPAITPKWFASYVTMFGVFGSDYIVNSWSPEDYRAQKGTSVAGYRALLALVNGVKETAKTELLNQPTLVFIDPKDELISANKLQDFVAKHHLTNWTITEVSNTGSNLPGKYHHLIIDEEAVGPKQWQAMLKKILAHLQP